MSLFAEFSISCGLSKLLWGDRSKVKTARSSDIMPNSARRLSAAFSDALSVREHRLAR